MPEKPSLPRQSQPEELGRSGARCVAKRCSHPGAAGTDGGVCPPRCSGDRRTHHLSPCRRHRRRAWHRGPTERRGQRGNPSPSLSRGDARMPPCSFGGGSSIAAMPNRPAVPPPRRHVPLPRSGGGRLQAGFTHLKKTLIFKMALSGAVGPTGLSRGRARGAGRAAPLPSRSPSAVYFSVSLGKGPLVAGRDV